MAKSASTRKKRAKPKLLPGEDRQSSPPGVKRKKSAAKSRDRSAKSRPRHSRAGGKPVTARGAGGVQYEPVDALQLIPLDAENLALEIEGKQVKLTNLQKVFWPESGYTKGDLLRYYASMSHVLLPHVRDRAMVMKRYPNGINGEFFFMKRTPEHAPPWLKMCPIFHKSENVISFPLVNDLASLLWTVNLGCIDLNQWYATCDDPDRPDYMHFDLDPVKPVGGRGQKEVPFERVREAALAVRDGLAGLDLPCYAKSSGSRGIHVYVPIKRGPLQKDVWQIAKAFSQTIARANPSFLTAVYAVAKRPAGHVLADYNQNAWGRTLASVYSVRPKAGAPVSAPVTWKEVERGFEIEDFRIDNMLARVKKVGDLFEPLLDQKKAMDLEKIGGTDS
jgi:bifunctional non-homologous end joining protein LigD